MPRVKSPGKVLNSEPKQVLLWLHLIITITTATITTIIPIITITTIIAPTISTPPIGYIIWGQIRIFDIFLAHMKDI